MPMAEDMGEPLIPEPRRRRGQPASPKHSRTQSGVDDASTRRSLRVAALTQAAELDALFDDDDTDVDGDTTAVDAEVDGKKEDTDEEDSDDEDTGDTTDSIATTKPHAPQPDALDTAVKTCATVMSVATVFFVVYTVVGYLTWG